MKHFIFIISTAMTALLLLSTGCRAIKPYEKEYLLNPLMDDAHVSRLSVPYGQSMRPKERLATSTGSGAGSACPTCGG